MDLMERRRAMMQSPYNTMLYTIYVSATSTIYFYPSGMSLISASCNGKEVTSRSASLSAGTYTIVLKTYEDTVPVGMFTSNGRVQAVELYGRWKEIGARAFLNCTALTTLTIPDTIEVFGDNALQSLPALTNLNGLSGRGTWYLPSVTTLGASSLYVGYGGHIGTIKFGDNLTEFGGTNGHESACFHSVGDPAFLTVDIGSGLQTIHAGAIDRCSILDFIVRATTPPTFVANRDTSIFFQSTLNGHILVPAGSVDAYKAADGWSQYASKIFEI